jgi:chaperonin GroES
MRPVHDRVLVLPEDAQEITDSGYIKNQGTVEKPKRGMVIAVGDGEINSKGELNPMTVKIGDIILYGKFAGAKVEISGKEYLVMKENEILIII